MPYIKQKFRKRLDKIIEKMHKEHICADGDLNYILFAYYIRYMPRNYNAIKNFCGELRQCATEIERRIMAQYENDKIEENGDV